MASVARPTWSFEVAWNADNRGLLVFDTSQFDGTDAFAVSAFDVTWGGPYSDLSADLEEIHYERGGSDDFAKVEAGIATILVRDPNGRLNPQNPASPLYGVIDQRLHPARLRVQSSAVGQRGAFTGFVRRSTFEPGQRRHHAQLELIDFFYWLSRGPNDDGGAKPTIASTGLTTVGAAVGKILDAVGWIDPAMRVLGAGDTIPDFSADGTKTALELIQELLEVDRGLFYVNGYGQAVYEDRWQRLVRASAATIAGVMATVAPTVDFDTVRNHAEVTKLGGILQTAEDADSVRRIGRNDWGAITSRFLRDDMQANLLALHEVLYGKDPIPPVYDLSIDARESTLLTQILTRELGDVLTVTEAATGTNVDGYIDRLSVDWDGGGLTKATYVLSKRTGATPAQFDVSTFDSGKVFVY